MTNGTHNSPRIPHSTILTIDLSSAVDSNGWMDTHAATRLLPRAHSYTGVVEVNIGAARAGYALDLIAEFLTRAEHVVVKGCDNDGLHVFSMLLTYYRPTEPDPTMGGTYDAPGHNPFLLPATADEVALVEGA
jgi:hypothetical protein